MDTKTKGDIAEQAIILQALKSGWGVLRPIGDRLSYDMVFDVGGKLVKIQSKYAWLNEDAMNFVVGTRMTKTNRRETKQAWYKPGDFDFAVAYVHPLESFWVFPFEFFVSYTSGISLVVAADRQRKSKAARFRNAWNLIAAWGAPGVIPVFEPVKFGEAVDLVIPSQAELNSEGVET